MFFFILTLLAVAAVMTIDGQLDRHELDFSGAALDPITGQLCMQQKICLSNLKALAKILPKEPCFPPGCNCNSESDCKADAAVPYCNNCTCSRFPQGCNCNGDSDCGDGDDPYCVGCQCSPFPQGCNCNIDSDCNNGFCNDCLCGKFRKGCSCNGDSDCGDSSPHCVDCQCSPFPLGCDCNGDGDCTNGFCIGNCTCSKFRQGCDCNSDPDCGNDYCINNCTCSRFPKGCDCGSDGDCTGGSNTHCVNCQCNPFPEGCDCNGDYDCGNCYCINNCTCSKFPQGCDCSSNGDCNGGINPFCVNCRCNRFPQGCDCQETYDCHGKGSCADCVCKSFPPGCTCNGVDDCSPEAPNCNDCRCSRFPAGCTCEIDSDCGVGGSARCVACNCKDCPVSAVNASVVINPPMTFVVDTTKSVKPDKFSIFNLTQKVVEKIVETKANVPVYQLVTFNDYGPDFNKNVEIRINTTDVVQFRQEIIGLKFESFDGGRDSKERLMQGLLGAVQSSPDKSLIVVFTDNGSKDLNLKGEIVRTKKEKQQTVYIVLTPVFEGFPNDPSLVAYAEVADRVFFIAEVGADTFLTTVQTFEQTNCV